MLKFLAGWFLVLGGAMNGSGFVAMAGGFLMLSAMFGGQRP
jgi:hypothetical protein